MSMSSSTTITFLKNHWPAPVPQSALWRAS
jgi:hypothetical protein